MGKRGFACDRGSKSPQTTCHGPRDQDGSAVLAYFREERFELPPDARQVRVNRFGVDVTGEKDNVKGQSVWCRVNGKMMKVAKGEVGVKC
jgi:hypothetical protein